MFYFIFSIVFKLKDIYLIFYLFISGIQSIKLLFKKLRYFIEQYIR